MREVLIGVLLVAFIAWVVWRQIKRARKGPCCGGD